MFIILTMTNTPPISEHIPKSQHPINKIIRNHTKAASPAFLSTSNCNPALIPIQNMYTPARQQNKSNQVGSRRGYFCVKVENAQSITPAGHITYPQNFQLKPLLLLMAVLQGYRPVGQLYSSRQDWLNCRDWKERLMTRGPIPISGTQLVAQEKQYSRAQPGRQSGTLTTDSHLYMTQLVKKFLNNIYAHRQQNQTQVTPLSMVMPTRYPSSMKCTTDSIGLALAGPRALAQSRPAYSNKSITGQPQINKQAEPAGTPVIMASQSKGIRQQQVKYSTAMQVKGNRPAIMVLQHYYLLLMTPTSTIITTARTQNMQSVQVQTKVPRQAGVMKIVRQISVASKISNAMPQLTYLRIRFQFQQTTCSMQMHMGSFHITQLKTSDSAIASASCSCALVQIALEFVVSTLLLQYVPEVVSWAPTYCETGWPSRQQNEARVNPPLMYLLMAQMPPYRANTNRNTSHETRKYTQEEAVGSGEGWRGLVGQEVGVYLSIGVV